MRSLLSTAAPSVKIGRVLGASRATRHLPFVAIFLIAVYLLTLNVSLIWRTNYEDVGLFFESVAINHLRFGLGFTKGQDFFDATVSPPTYGPQGIGPRGIDPAQQIQYLESGPAQPLIYAHHPPLLGLTVAASFLVFGVHYWAERLVPITFTLGALVLFYILMNTLFDTMMAAFSSLLFVAFPITAYYGRNVAHEAPSLFCELGMILCYTLWRRSGQRRWLGLLAGCVFLGVWYGWPMVYFAFILFAVEALSNRRIHFGLLASTVLTAAGALALVVLQIYLAAGYSLWTLQSVFGNRVGGPVGGNGDSLIGWLAHMLQNNAGDFGSWTLIALPASIVFLIAQFEREGASTRMIALISLALGGAAHILIFREGAYIHEYWQFYLIPFYAASIGWAGTALARRISATPATRVAALVVLACMVLALNLPLIFNLYAGGMPYGAPATGPVTPITQVLTHGR